MTREGRDKWNREHRCCGACKHWNAWDDNVPEELSCGDCMKIDAGTEYDISEDGKTVYTFDGCSFEDECYDECLHCFEERTAES